MATIQDIPRVNKDSINANTGAIYHVEASINAGANSEPYELPVQHITAISVYVDDGAGGNADGSVEFTNDPSDVVEADNALWVAWDGTKVINTGLTYFRLARTSGTVRARVTVRTADM